MVWGSKTLGNSVKMENEKWKAESGERGKRKMENGKFWIGVLCFGLGAEWDDGGNFGVDMR